jgi:hypothetical protein
MSRSQYIFGRIRRVLRTKDISAEKFRDTEVYDEMQQAQNQIFARVNIEQDFTIYLNVGIGSYPLCNITDDRNVIGKIKTFITPSTWRYDIEYVPYQEWNYVINSGRFDQASNPIKATIFNNNLLVYPLPQAKEKLILYTLIIGSMNDIDQYTDPDLRPMWDKAIEYGVLHNLLSDVSYFKLFEEQIETLSKEEFNKGRMLQQPMV